MEPVEDADGATVAVAGVIHQDIDPELGEVPDLEGYGVCVVVCVDFQKLNKITEVDPEPMTTAEVLF